MRSACAVLAFVLAGFGPWAAAAERRGAAEVQGATYCVGGLDLTPAGPSRERCETHRDVHPKWHRHCFVQGPDGKCRTCWDEQDNTCESIFLHDVRYPGFHKVEDIYDCARSGTTPPDGEEIRVERGEAVSAPPPPPPPPTDVTAEVHVSPGPYGEDDLVAVEIRASGADGKARPVLGGEVLLRGADGSERGRLPVRQRLDGSAVVDVRIPPGGDISLEFVSGRIGLSAQERLGKVHAAPVHLKVDRCRLRGAMLAPRSGEVLVVGAPLALRGQLTDAQGKPVGADALGSGTHARFALTLASGRTEELEATVSPAGLATATFTPGLPASDSEDLAVRLVGVGGVDLCPGAPVQLRLTRLGVSIDLVEPRPDGVCYVGRPCRVAVQLRLPSGGDARTAAARFVHAAALKIEASLDGEPLGPLAPAPPAYALAFQPDAARWTELEIRATDGVSEVRQRQRLRIRQPIVLALPAELDLGTIKAGSPWHQACRELDFSRSRGVEEQEFLLQSELPPGCGSSLVVADDHGRAFPLAQGQRLTLGIRRTARLCLEVPRCAGERPPPARLTVRPTSDDFREQLAVVQVRWVVDGRDFLTCNLVWLAIAAGGIFSLILIYGFLAPYRFSLDDTVKIAMKQQALGRAVARRLLDLPGGRAGFYRSAATGLRQDGSATRRLRGATLVLAARRGEIVVRSPGPVLRLNPRTRKMEPLASGREGHVALKGVIYQAGELFFQVT